MHHHLGFTLCAAARCLCGRSIRSQRGAMTRSLISLPVRFQTPVCLPPAILTSTDGQSISIGSTVAKCGKTAFLVFRDAPLNLYLKSRWSEIDPRLPRTLHDYSCDISDAVSSSPLHICHSAASSLWIRIRGFERGFALSSIECPSSSLCCAAPAYMQGEGKAFRD